MTAEELEARAGEVIRTLIPVDSNITPAQAEDSDRRLRKYRQQRPYVVVPPVPNEDSLPLTDDTVLKDSDKLVQRMLSVN